MQRRLSKGDGVDESGSSSSSAEPGLDRRLCISKSARHQDSKTAFKVSARALADTVANAIAPE